MVKDILPAGTTVNDRYVLERKLGSDGDVYEAYDRHLNRQVAFKLLHPQSGSPQSWHEARILEQLQSRFIVPVMNADIVSTSDLRYIVTRLLPDGDLESEAKPHGISTMLAARLGQHIASGLDAVHAAGMVHRDIKPANALLDSDIALVSDFEFCSLIDEDGLAPRTGSWCTLAPEVALEQGKCSVASDVYSLAATVFYLLSGEYPVDHRLPREEQQRLIAQGGFRDLAQLAPHVPRAVVSVLRRGMSLDPGRRPASATELGNALATAAADRRSWLRVTHEGHKYCAESESPRRGKSLGVCASPASPGKVDVRAFHLKTGRAVSGMPASEVGADELVATLRRVFVKVA